MYAKFGNKPGLLKAVLDQAIIGTDHGPVLLEHPAITEVQQSADQAEQLRLLARFSAGTSTRAIKTHRILATAAAIDRAAADLLAQDLSYRLTTLEQAYIDLLLVNGPLRDGLSKADAASAYSALASPETFDFLTRQQEWTKAKFETWLAETLINLLPPPNVIDLDRTPDQQDRPRRRHGDQRAAHRLAHPRADATKILGRPRRPRSLSAPHFKQLPPLPPFSMTGRSGMWPRASDSLTLPAATPDASPRGRCVTVPGAAGTVVLRHTKCASLPEPAATASRPAASSDPCRGGPRSPSTRRPATPAAAPSD